jgi:hypothetical protein
MRLRDIVCNRDLLGRECEKMIDKLHDGHGCPKNFGLQKIECDGNCEDCYDGDSNIIQKFTISNNKRDLKDCNEYYLRKK